MKLTIKTTDVNAVHKVCVNHDLKFYYYHDSKPGLTEITIRNCNGGEISSALAFSLGREVEAQLELEQTEKRIQEYELLQQPNNVVYTVELTEDLA